MYKKNTAYLVIWSLSILFSCSKQGGNERVISQKNNVEKQKLDFVKEIEKAHFKTLFESHKAISFDIQLFFNNKERLNANIVMLTNSGKVKINKKDGTELLYNGKDMLVFPPEANNEKARFDMFTWSYFFAIPYKLSDPGTIWEVQKEKTMFEKEMPTAKLTFESGTGDSPKDWYLVYKNEKTNLISAMAYIVTLGKTLNEAEKNPHAITYEEYKKVEGILFATSWKFWEWNEVTGATKELGNAKISNIKFIDERVGEYFLTRSS